LVRGGQRKILELEEKISNYLETKNAVGSASRGMGPLRGPSKGGNRYSMNGKLKGRASGAIASWGMKENWAANKWRDGKNPSRRQGGCKQ